ncbi:probable cytochrome P450 12d1 proximal, mitochondrial [Ylistrum balloti]|uniref:probable cytochrome P450 12d1 proximal, mitochondrial n=1 Tax=Ylistrum balloti TaxID=509963 RepID=UPI002905847A|nr:probable cytochrome P450 12d1 proximal, mitochondrial [Ylistrum balloti]
MPGTCNRPLMSLTRNLLKKPKCNNRGKATMVSADYLEGSTATDTSRIASDVRPFEELPGPKCYPIIGTLPYYLPGGRFYKMEHNEVSAMLRREFGNLYKETIPGGNVLVHTFDAADMETVYRNDGKFPIREAFFTLSHYNKKFVSNCQGLLTSQMEQWYQLRVNIQKKMLLPKTVAAYIPEHCLVADDFIGRLASSKEEDGTIDDIRDVLTKYAAECIGVVCFNKRFGAFQDAESEMEATRFIESVKDVMKVSHLEFRQIPLFKIFNTPTFNKLIKSQNFIKQIAIKYSNLALEAAQKKQNDGENVDGEHGDLVPYLMSKTSLTDEQVLVVISEFIFAGVDTTSHHISFILYLLGRHPHVQNKLYSEIQAILPTTDISINERNIRNMSYLKAVIKETHRMLPVATGNIRRTNVDLVLSGYHIPAGTSVAMHSDFSCQDAKEFPEPDSFVPERWLRESNTPKTNHPFAMVPFGFGPRACIGMRFAEQEAQIAVIKILQRYHVEYVGETLRREASITYRPANKLAFRFTER